ncbi:hypothetical protein [Nodosilinea sp. FACHB-13]|uniref:hypothetical protein n=1 Tax=Cyanophyceae TaxID=3028117 RepID=UPI0016877DE5|nr:hypothetical protein [Nodosilinea sp. FACHB-13]MBD2107285.1 hypothetical protein [Nodosilinea sp. FACHB-13]
MLRDKEGSKYSNKDESSDTSRNELSTNQRSHLLKEASSDYLKGKVTKAELEKIEEDLSTDYGEAAYHISTLASILCNALQKLVDPNERKLSK